MWYYAEGKERPAIVDETSSKKWVYVRRNIEEFEREDETDPTIKEKFYRWEEMKIPKENWELYKAVERNTANIDYIAMMEDIEIEDGEDDE
jgi:hypothetical protein